MKKTIFPVGNIKSDILRRAAMFIAFPLLVLWYFNWRLVALPLSGLWDAIETAPRAAVESIRPDFSPPPIPLLGAAWKRVLDGFNGGIPLAKCPQRRPAVGSRSQATTTKQDGREGTREST